MEYHRAGFTMLIFLLATFPSTTFSHWWLLSSQVFSVGSTIGCNSIAGLVKTQKRICRKYPRLMTKIGDGAKLALSECQQQFTRERWNCSISDRDTSILGKLMRKGNREAAFFYSVSSAGVVHEVTRACSVGELENECGCDKSLAGQRTSKFEWNGCDDNIQFGNQFSRAFLDAREEINDARALMNKHNNEAGRRAVGRHMMLDCKCHGVSGSCSVKTCRRSLSPFGLVGDYLHEKYNGAILVSLDQSLRGLVVAINVHKPPTPNDLVYLETSPDYCKYDPRSGTVGIAGRECNRTSDGSDGCDIMCCGLGFNTMQVEEIYNCECEFKWCCQVKCKKCRRTVKKHFCKAPETVQLPIGETYGETIRNKLRRHKKARRNRKNKKNRKQRKKKRRLKNKLPETPTSTQR